MMNLELLKAICEAATPGPWDEKIETDECGGHYAVGPHHYKERGKDRKHYRDVENQVDADAKFITIARQEMRGMIETIEKLNNLAKELIERVKKAENPGSILPGSIQTASSGDPLNPLNTSQWPVGQWPAAAPAPKKSAPTAPPPPAPAAKA